MSNRVSIGDLDKFCKQNAWMDFEVRLLNPGTILICGSTDFSYFHQLEILCELSKDIEYYEWTTSPQEQSWVIQVEDTRGGDRCIVFNSDDGIVKIEVYKYECKIGTVRYWES